MNGIVSLLDDHHYQLIEDLWAELKREFAVEGVYITPYPHLSYQVASSYDVEQLEDILHNFAAYHSPFQVRTTGLGIFTGPQPVLYIPVVRSPELTQFHHALWQRISRAGEGIQAYYHPDQWMPHITIGFGDLTGEKLAQIVRYLSERDFNWEITVDNVAFIHDNGKRQVLKVRYDLGTGCAGMIQQRPAAPEILEELERVHEQVLRDSKGQLFEDSAEVLRQQREERTKYLEEISSWNAANDEKDKPS